MVSDAFCPKSDLLDQAVKTRLTTSSEVGRYFLQAQSVLCRLTHLVTEELLKASIVEDLQAKAELPKYLCRWVVSPWFSFLSCWHAGSSHVHLAPHTPFWKITWNRRSHQLAKAVQPCRNFQEGLWMEFEKAEGLLHDVSTPLKKKKTHTSTKTKFKILETATLSLLFFNIPKLLFENIDGSSCCSLSSHSHLNYVPEKERVGWGKFQSQGGGGICSPSHPSFFGTCTEIIILIIALF